MPYPHESPRPLTDAEWNSLHPYFPQMDRTYVYYIGAATSVYNCLAWSLGVQNSFIWPWPYDKKVTINDFYALYKQWGMTQWGYGPIDLWGMGNNDMKHGSIFLQVPGFSGETSKMGQNILLLHRLGDIAQGIYGTLIDNVGPARPETLQDQEEALGSLLQGENTLQDSGSPEKPAPILYSISEEETDALRQQLKKVKQEVKDLFDQAYAAWTQTWAQPAIQMSSNPNDYARSQEFNDLVAMGPDILPLLVEKMSNGREFLVLQAVERLLPSSLIFRPAVDDPAIFAGEQLRAHMTAKRWLASI